MPASPAAQAAQLFAAHYGALVTGAAKTLPASGSGDIFTVTGGRVVITSITGVVSTVIQNQACTLSVGHKPTGGSSQVATLATATSIIAAALGTSIAAAPFSGGSPAALAVIAPTAVVPGTDLGVALTAGGLALVPAGTIQVTTSATNTGAIIYSISYVPYDVGATITAA
jgi:hypothetical protein